MKRMAMVLDRDQRQMKSKLESSKGDTFSGAVINDALYGPEDGSGLGEALDEMKRYDELRKWTSDDWVTLLKQCVSSRSSYCHRNIGAVDTILILTVSSSLVNRRRQPRSESKRKRRLVWLDRKRHWARLDWKRQNMN